MEEVGLVMMAMEEKDKQSQERDAGFFSVIASCTTGKSFKPSDFIHDPEREAKKEKVAGEYAKKLSESRKAYEAMNGMKKLTAKD